MERKKNCNETKKLKYLKGVRGITLIALVITIVVLLILAGVTIATLTGENGILTRANDAKEKTEQAEKDEKTNLSRTEDLINQYVDGIEVEQVTDENPGVLETEGTDTYIINSIEDLVVFASNVREGNTYEGQTVKLGLSLDFNSSKSYVDPFRTDYEEYGYDGELKTLLTSGEGFKSIGTDVSPDDITNENSFAGIFEGNNNVLYNCYMQYGDDNTYYLALFGSILNGEVRDLGLVNLDFANIRETKGASIVAGFCIRLAESAKIENCYVTGSIKGITNSEKASVNVAGLVAYNRGIIENSYNTATIYGDLKNENSTGGCYIGGIAVNVELSKAVVRNSYNLGKIVAKTKLGNAAIGGISRNISSGSTVENCYNKGELNCYIDNIDNSIAIGGVVGTIDDSSCFLKNSYNVGKIAIFSNIDFQDLLKVGGIIGVNQGKNISNGYNVGEIEVNGENALVGEIAGEVREDNNSSVSNMYYLKNTPFGKSKLTGNEAVLVTEEELKNLEVTLGDMFKKDSNNINNGYPILNWQCDPTMGN